MRDALAAKFSERTNDHCSILSHPLLKIIRCDHTTIAPPGMPLGFDLSGRRAPYSQLPRLSACNSTLHLGSGRYDQMPTVTQSSGTWVDATGLSGYLVGRGGLPASHQGHAKSFVHKQTVGNRLGPCWPLPPLRSSYQALWTRVRHRPTPNRPYRYRKLG